MIKTIVASVNVIPGIFKIEQEAFLPPWTYESLLNEVSREDSYFITAFNEYETEELSSPHSPPSLLGYAVLRQVGDDGELLKIAVDKQARRKGVGALLMADVLNYAADKAFKSVFLEVRKSNAAAVKLYEKYGFAVVRTRKDYYDKPVEDALIMVKESR